MKIAGTLQKPQTAPAAPEEIPKPQEEKQETANMEGLTAKQRKNLKKKQQRKKKKAQANNDAAGSDDEESAEEETKNPTEAPKADAQKTIEDPSKKKKQVKKASIVGRGDKQIGNLLNEDDDDFNGANHAS